MLTQQRQIWSLIGKDQAASVANWSLSNIAASHIDQLSRIGVCTRPHYVPEQSFALHPITGGGSSSNYVSFDVFVCTPNGRICESHLKYIFMPYLSTQWEIDGSLASGPLTIALVDSYKSSAFETFQEIYL